CYKQKFYGISSHRCLQMTPTAFHCTMRCLFCWRVQPDDIGVKTDEVRMKGRDDPSFIVEESIKAQRRILSGYKAHEEIAAKKYIETLNPNHAAISLTGEPTLYRRLGDLIQEFHKRNMTTFLVTSGTIPTALSNISREPSQLYVSLYAPDEKTFRKTCRPQIPRAWHRVKESLKILKSFKCPTVIRLTLIKNLNLKNPEGYAKLVSESGSTYVEAKSYMCVGFSRRRLSLEDMPTHREIKLFSQKLSGLTGYKIINESPESRVVLLSRLDKSIKIR
ncbi:MAG: 4-demethylwyosine synthase TYW1, partial [Candidatus Bathyarchaeota archaeon]